MSKADYERGFDDGFILRKEKDGKRKPLTDEQIKECSYDADGFMISRERAMRNVEKAHGIGEKE